MIMTVEQVDLIIVGAGPAGLAAAAEVSRKKGSVVVVDESPTPGGRLPSQIHREPGRLFSNQAKWSNGQQKAARLFKEAIEAGAKVVCGASVWDVSPGWFVGVVPTDPFQGNNIFPYGFEARAVIIATGAGQNPVPLPGWTLPGVMTAGAAQALINVHQVLPGRRAVVIGIDPLSISVAQLMAAVGVDVQGVFLPPSNALQLGPTTPQAAICELSRLTSYAPSFGLSLIGRLAGSISELTATLFPRDGVKIGGFPLMLHRTVQAIEGTNHAKQVEIVTLSSKGRPKPGSVEHWQVDVVINSAGLYPLVELAQVAGCPLVYVAGLGGWVPVHSSRLETPTPGLFVAGSITGVEGASVAEAQGRVAGIAAAQYLGLANGPSLERDLEMHQVTVKAARRAALPFLPNIKDGRTYMSQYWSKYKKKPEKISTFEKNSMPRGQGRNKSRLED